MKLSSFFFLFICYTLISCQETPPAIDFSAPELFLLEKNTYTIPEHELPVKQNKNALIEDVTGVRCQNCPAAAEKARELKNTNPGRVVVVGIYTKNYPTLTSPHDEDMDLRTAEATSIHDVLYAGTPLPGGGVNRKVYPGQTAINQMKDLWPSRVNSELSLESDVNLTAALKWVNDSTVDIEALFVFRTNRTDKVLYSLMLLEDGLVTAQTGGGGVLIEEYEHEHVLRKMYTPYSGSPLIEQPETGKAVDIKWRIYLPDYVDYNKSSLVLFLNLNEENNQEVLQCIELKLK